jgi:hypothetical protein
MMPNQQLRLAEKTSFVMYFDSLFNKVKPLASFSETRPNATDQTEEFGAALQLSTFRVPRKEKSMCCASSQPLAHTERSQIKPGLPATGAQLTDELNLRHLVVDIELSLQFAPARIPGQVSGLPGAAA